MVWWPYCVSERHCISTCTIYSSISTVVRDGMRIVNNPYRVKMPKMFCFHSLKPSKPKKGRNSEVNSQVNHNNDNQHSTSIPLYRHVTSEFNAVAPDELSVLPSDIVIVQFTDSNSSGNWSHVISLRTQKSGFVPSDILSAELRTNTQAKKKIPRSTVDPIDHHNHIHRVHVGDQPSSNDDNVLLQHQHASEHQPRFSIPHSLQGSSSTKQSLMKYPNLAISGNFSTPGYYNQPPLRVRQCDPRYERNELEWRPFLRGNHGLFIVLHNFVSREENDLSVNPGEFVTVLNKDDDDWFWVRRECDGKEGFVPSRFIYDYEQVKYILNKGNSTVTMKSSNHNDCHTYINHGPERESLLTDQQSSLCHQHI